MTTTPTPAQLYKINNYNTLIGIQGYHITNKYHDPIKIKYQRLLNQSKNKYKAPKPLNTSKKYTFIDELQKYSGKYPGPSTYQTEIIKNKSKTTDIVKYSNRKTFVDEILLLEKKNHIPGANMYQNIGEGAEQRKKCKSSLSKAQNGTYLDGCMRNAIECPGVGTYQTSHQNFDHRLGKWVADPQKNKNDKNIKKSSKSQLPSVGSYNPNPVSYKLFSSISQKQTIKNNIGIGGTSSRFNYNYKDKKLPFYNVLSQWGMKNKLKKKDIMANISTHRNVNSSVYY